MLRLGRYKAAPRTRQINKSKSRRYVPFERLDFSLDRVTLQKSYLDGKQTVTSVVKHLLSKAKPDDCSWTLRIPTGHILGEADRLDKEFKSNPKGTLEKYPLFGLPFAVKDNIDIAGFQTTSGCKEYAYTSWQTNPAVQRSLDAGAICMGKNNMDQFASGLVGTRSPYGTPENPFNAEYVPGGSTSGGGVVVSTGQVSFAFSTDTAGSGRVPAGFMNIVGLKPTKGLVSTRGVVPACRSLDCVGILALTCDDAWDVLKVVEGYDFDDEYSRHKQDHLPFSADDTFRIGIPKQLQFYGLDIDAAEKMFHDALRVIQSDLKTEIVEIDFRPFTEIARMLYDGPWVAERLSALRAFYETNAKDIYPVTQKILERAKNFSAVDTFVAMRKMEKHRKEVEKIWTEAGLHAMVVPTASVTPTVSGVKEFPFWYNTVLGYYTNYMNLVDLCGMAVPNGFLPSGVPNGITFVAPAWQDSLAYFLGRRFQMARNLPMGASKHNLPKRSVDPQFNLATTEEDFVHVAVAGAHMSGMSLNHQLLGLNGKFESVSKTAPTYKIFDITKPGDKVQRPGIVKVPQGGTSVEVELWRMSAKNFGKFMQMLKAPLTIGLIELDNGKKVHGFLCESYAIATSKDISSFGGWRAYEKSTPSKPPSA